MKYKKIKSKKQSRELNRDECKIAGGVIPTVGIFSNKVALEGRIKYLNK